MASRLAKRIMKEIQTLQKETQSIGIKMCIPGVSGDGEAAGAGAGAGAGHGGGGGAVPALLTTPWKAFMRGPEGTAYEGCVYAISIQIPPDYPHRPPTIMFLNQCWHPNIGVNGHVCVDILQREWSPTLSVIKILQSVQSMLDDPDPSSPLNASAAEMYGASKSSPLRLAEYRAKIQASCTAAGGLSESDKHFDPGASVLC
jgi:ubiquitin-conjugating enzyme E2 D